MKFAKILQEHLGKVFGMQICRPFLRVQEKIFELLEKLGYSNVDDLSRCEHFDGGEVVVD
jgi:hypothetical protein